MATAEHGSFLAINHTGQVVKKAFNDSKAASDFKLHGMKCTEVIKQVLGHILTVLADDLGNSKYSLLLDESTDINSVAYPGGGVGHAPLATWAMPHAPFVTVQNPIPRAVLEQIG